jgi:hypothetical protein
LYLPAREQACEPIEQKRHAVATEPLNVDIPSCLLVNTSEEGLLAFSRECGVFNFSLLPADKSLVILCTVYDYYLVAGPFEFVACAVAGDINVAWTKFKEISC